MKPPVLPPTLHVIVLRMKRINQLEQFPRRWFQENDTGRLCKEKHSFQMFPVKFPLNQSIELWGSPLPAIKHGVIR
jgi:hypothetical protein